MAKRYWITASILWLAVLLLPRPIYCAQEQEQPKTEKIEIPLPPFALIDDSKKSYGLESPCEPGEDNRNSDLCAQWKAADAAFESAEWERLNFSLGVGGVITGLVTLASAIAAAFFAKRASDAAWRAVNVTRDIGEAQVRAYLYCSSARYERSSESVSVIVELGNSGNSPASKVTIFGHATISDVGGTRFRPRVTRWVHSQQTETTAQPVFANGKVRDDLAFSWDYHFRSEDGDALEDSEFRRDTFVSGNHLEFDLTVSWTDVFNNIHEFPLNLHAIIDAHPLSPNKKRSSKGVLEFRMDDVSKRVVGETVTLQA